MAISLPTVVTGYLTSVKNSLTLGSDLGSNVRGAAQNYLRAQDMSTVLDLLQEALSHPADEVVTATGGSATTAISAAATYVAGTQAGNVVTFAADTTTAGLRGVEVVVKSNTATTLTFASTLPASVANTDTFSIRAAFLDGFISALRQGKSRGDNPPGNIYGDYRTALGGLVLGIQQLGGTAPSMVSDMIQVHPGGQPGDNARLANLINAFQSAVAASTVPASA